jgi:diguanylate cyclase (GGDEF)-like protein
MSSGLPVVRNAVVESDLPALLRTRAGSAAAWVPLFASGDLIELLIVLRDHAYPFNGDDIGLLSVAASRLYLALEAIDRGDALERLARAGPELARHIDVEPLLDEAVELFRQLTAADSAFIVSIENNVFSLARFSGTDQSIPRRWPRTPETMPQWHLFSRGEVYVGPRSVIAERPDETDPSPIVLCVPVMRNGTAVLLLGATGHRARSFGKTGVDIARIMAGHLSVALTNAELYRVLTEREDDLRHQAAHDPLTGLANRVTVGQRIDEALAAATSGAVGVLFCDVDQFKAVNDRLGHEVGDELLQQIASRLANGIRPGDLLARFGGDEFVIVLANVRGLNDLTEAGRRLQLRLADPVLLRGERMVTSVSIGAVLGRRGTSAGVMLRDADAAMYAAKAKGPGRVEVFDDAASNRSLDWLDLRSDLGQALERGQLSVLYQPLVDLKTDTFPSFEALVRWTHPQHGPVPPDTFIPMAEETGAIVPIGAWVLAEACARLVEWQRLFPDAGLTIGVNISAVQLEHSRQDVLSVILQSGVDPHDVWLEVTERMDTSADVSGQVNRLRRAGVHFALDDFGMSYSSLTYLQRFPVEGIKIDRTFVSPMTEGETQRGIVRAILALGESLSVNVVAEGIETVEQRDALLDLGCRYGQGYLLSPPLTAAECVRALRTRS